MNIYEKRIAWFNEARFGMFIHWGLYSVLGRGEWAMFTERIQPGEYAKLAHQFKPRKFDPDSWAAVARQAGMKYMILTTRHHDGFCLFDSKVSDFTSVKTAAKKDFVADYVKSCRRAGLKVGLYYSLGDWRFGMPKISESASRAKDMVAQAQAQIKELMSNYGKIDILWYDGNWCYPSLPHDGNIEIAKFWKAHELNAMVRTLQPDILINDRSGLPEDFGTPEGHVVAEKVGRAGESCMTMGDSCFSGWGYVKNVLNFKTTAQLIQNLAIAASGAGNLLLNVGPRPSGEFCSQELKRLREIGTWMQVNGESIYGSERLPVEKAGISWGFGAFGTVTVKGKTAYLHFFRWPGETATAIGIGNRVISAKILGSSKKLQIKQTPDGQIFLKGLPKKSPNNYDTVIALQLDSKPRIFNYTGTGQA